VERDDGQILPSKDHQYQYRSTPAVYSTRTCEELTKEKDQEQHRYPSIHSGTDKRTKGKSKEEHKSKRPILPKRKTMRAAEGREARRVEMSERSLKR